MGNQLQRRIGWTLLLILAVGIVFSIRIVLLGDQVQVVNHLFISEKLPLSQRIGELRGVIADEERVLYEYYSYTATRDAFQAQRQLNAQRLSAIVAELAKDRATQTDVMVLRQQLSELGQLSDGLSATLASIGVDDSIQVDWDRARALLAQIKPQVRQIEQTLLQLTVANQQAVDQLGADSKLSVETMVRWVFGYAILILVIAVFVGYYDKKLAYQAFFDPATELPNQYRLRADLDAALLRHTGTVMLIVADREQEIFESFGAVETERWLVKIAQRLREGLDSETERLYRFRENTFVLWNFSGGLQHAEQRAAQLLANARQPLLIDGRELFSTLSIGAASLGNSEICVESTLQQAASACNRVDRAGGNDYAPYDEAMSRSVDKALRLAADLQHAVENNQLCLHYQPKVSSIDGSLLGMEALVRWIHPERGMISPIEFIPVAEDTGLIVGIGRWVLREACRQNAQWLQEKLPPLRVAVNLSARQFRSGDLLSEIDAALAESGLPVQMLELEITESMVMDDPESVIKLLGAIHGRGIHLSLDDFGTGHSSLAYLKRFPIDCVKIDRAFVKDTPENTGDVAIAKTIVAMAKALNLATVAEGVETAAQLELLRNMGCEQIQGYYFSRPLPAEDFLAYYRKQGHATLA